MRSSRVSEDEGENNMKKLIAFFLLAAVLVGMVSCGCGESVPLTITCGEVTVTPIRALVWSEGGFDSGSSDGWGAEGEIRFRDPSEFPIIATVTSEEMYGKGLVFNVNNTGGEISRVDCYDAEGKHLINLINIRGKDYGMKPPENPFIVRFPRLIDTHFNSRDVAFIAVRIVHSQRSLFFKTSDCYDYIVRVTVE